MTVSMVVTILAGSVSFFRSACVLCWSRFFVPYRLRSRAWSFLFMQLSMWTAIPLPWKFLDFVAPGTLSGVSSGFERWGMCHAWSLRTQAVCQVPEANALPQAGGSICAFAPWAETPKHKLSQLYAPKQSARVWGAFILQPVELVRV